MNDFNHTIIEGTALANNIPVIWAIPSEHNLIKEKHLVIWQTCFAGKKERVIPQLQDLAKRGFYALSFDLYEHGERTVGKETHEEMVERVSSNRRLYFWPIIARTAEDFPRLIDWAIEQFNINGKIIAGGISMGGDICLVASSIDKRIHAVCAAIATPDWLRPGSIEEQGTADALSQALYDRYNPITHIHSYAHLPYIHFENAGADSYVPAEAAHRFTALLAKHCYSGNIERLSIFDHPNKEHGFHPEMWPNCLQWINKLV